MATYMVGYDLNTPGKNYDRLIDAIKTYSPWWHNLDSTWILRTDRSAVEVRDHLARYIDQNDELLVAELTGVGAWRGFAKDGSDWLINYL